MIEAPESGAPNAVLGWTVVVAVVLVVGKHVGAVSTIVKTWSRVSDGWRRSMSWIKTMIALPDRVAEIEKRIGQAGPSTRKTIEHLGIRWARSEVNRKPQPYCDMCFHAHNALHLLREKSRGDEGQAWLYCSRHRDSIPVPGNDYDQAMKYGVLDRDDLWT